MNGGRDWRRREAEHAGIEDTELIEKEREDIVEDFTGWDKTDQKVSLLSMKEPAVAI